MGSTFISYRNQGFEANDAVVEVWLHLLVCEIDKLTDAPAWLLEIRDEWHVTASQGFGFGADPSLDQFITNDEKRRTILEISEAARKAIEGYGESIDRDTLNSMQTGGEGSVFTQDLPTGMFKTLARYFIHLLEGRLAPTETDARF